LIKIICITLTGTVLVACATSDEKKKAAYDNGQAYYEKAEYNSAVLEFKNAIQIDPVFADAYFMLGMVEYKQQHFKEAYANFIRVSELDPDHLENNLELAKILLLGKKIDPAGDRLDAVLKINPQHPEASQLKAGILVAQKKYPAAIEILERLIEQGSRSPDAYSLLAAALFTEKEMDRAEETIKAGIEANPDVISLHTALAGLYINGDRHEEAVKTLQKTISKHPEDVALKVMLANLLWNTGRGTEAENILNAILSAQPDNMENLEQVVRFYISKNQFMKAERQIKDGIQRQPEHFRLRFLLGKLLEAQNRVSDAFETLQVCLTLSEDPTHPDIILTKNLLAKLHFKQGEIDSAEQYVEQIINHAPDNIPARSLLADIHNIHGKPEEAISQLETIIEKHPQYIPGYISLAKIYELYDDQDKAGMTLVKALRSNSGSTQLLLAYARLLFAMDKFTRAEAILNMLIDADPNDPSIMVQAGDLYLMKEQFHYAAKHYETAISKAPDNPIGYIRLADLHNKKGEIDKSLDYLLRGYEISPKSDRIFSNLVKYNIILKKYDDALMLCRERLKQFPGSAVAYNQFGVVYGAQGRFDEAMAAYNQAIKIRPRWSDPRNNLIRLYLSGSERREKEMIRKLRLAYIENPSKSEIYRSLALLYEKSGEYDKAKTVYRQVLKNTAFDGTVANNLAYLMIEYPTQDSDLDQAVVIARKALIYNPGNPGIIDTLGWAYYHKGDYNQAIPLLKISHKALPEHPTIDYHLGMALHGAGLIDEARARFVSALSGQKDFPGRDEASRLIEEIPPPPKKQMVAHKPIDFDRISTDDLKSLGSKSLIEEMEAKSGLSMNSSPGGGALELDGSLNLGLK